VSHAAPAHHFGDKAGILTAFAAEGYELLAYALIATQQRTGEFPEVGVTYVRFATAEHRPDDVDLKVAGVAAWSLVHGFASLWLHGSLPAELRHDPGRGSSSCRGAVPDSMRTAPACSPTIVRPPWTTLAIASTRIAPGHAGSRPAASPCGWPRSPGAARRTHWGIET
jgi:hypothetical protein